MEDIRNLEDLIRPHLPAGSQIMGQTSTRLTMPGENYGSLMKRLEVTIKKSDGEEDILHLVAKQIPANPWLQKMFNVQETFVKEMNVYAKLVPTLVEFQKEHGMDRTLDCFPKYFGGRKNLNGSDVVDEDGVILLENLKVSGYTTWDRFTGFDLEGARRVLEDLAMFHAVPLAFKLEKPEVFEREIAPVLKYVKCFDGDQEEMERKFGEKMEMFAKKVYGGDGDLVKRAVQVYWDGMKAWPEQFESIFNTAAHNDFWVNNTMVKIADGKVVDNKIIDFQLTDFNSSARDVVFFLYSSVQTPVIEKCYDNLVRFYYDNFIGILEKLNCDASAYTFEAFEEEMALAAKRGQFFHCVMMTKPMYAAPQGVKELDEMTQDDLIDKEEDIPEGEMNKAKFIIREFAKRKWL